MYNCDIRVPSSKNALFYFLFWASCRHRIGLRDKVCRDTGIAVMSEEILTNALQMNHTNYEFSSLHLHKSACMAA